MAQLSGRRIAILATHGFEQSELTVPKRKVEEQGARVEVVSPQSGEIKGWNHTDWGDSVPVDTALEAARVEDYDALVLPGGQINPDLLRIDDKAVGFVRDFHATGKPLAAVCHAPWLLIEAELARGRTLTGYKSIRTDLRNAGASVVDEAVAVDGNIITSRQPDDLDAFSDRIATMVAEGGGAQAQVA